jgi:hypothetical protein
MSSAEVICDTPLNRVTNRIPNANEHDLEFTKNDVILKCIISYPMRLHIGQQIDVEFEDGKYLIPMKVWNHEYNGEIASCLQLRTTTQKCVDWLIKRYDISFDDDYGDTYNISFVDSEGD